MSARVSAIVLAAGLSRRMGFNKLTADLCGAPMLSRVLELVASYGFYERLLVTTENVVGEVIIPEGFTVVINRNPEEGQSSSLRLGVSTARGDAYLFFPADQPFLTHAVPDRLIAGYNGRAIRVPTVGGEPRSPALFPALLRDELLELRGDVGGRSLYKKHFTLCEYIAFDDIAGMLRDIDTPDDLDSARV